MTYRVSYKADYRETAWSKISANPYIVAAIDAPEDEIRFVLENVYKFQVNSIKEIEEGELVEGASTDLYFHESQKLIVKLMMRGNSTKDIAETLGIPIRSVKYWLSGRHQCRDKSTITLLRAL